MRITGGKYIRRKILCPPGEIRPAMDRMRESMFAILGSLESMSFLDLFSGSGIVGIEAASRGAKRVVFVEGDYKKRKILLQNVSLVEAEKKVVIWPVEKYIARSGESFDYIFLDPPFKMKKKQIILQKLLEYDVAVEGTVLIIHLPRKEYISPVIGDRLILFDIRKYGGSCLYFYHVSSRRKATI